MADWRPYLTGLQHGAIELVALALWFCALAWVVKRGRAWADARAAAGETRINLILHVVDALAVTPVVVFVAGSLIKLMQQYGLTAPSQPLWTLLGFGGTALAALVIGDFAGYWRHRLQHAAWLWPAHAIHHSDTRLTWLSLSRTHPVDRLGTILDILVLAAVGLPAWVVSITVLARHYWGHFIHADIPWTLGKAGLVLNSPVAHRWHHARDLAGSGANFATLFSIFDRAFGTFHAPGPCDVPLGVREDMGKGVVGQYLHPFKVWLRSGRDQIRSRSQATSGASAGGIG
jgi:sterol desaturase/sphingolipid hydroxylase (fatty acid hydroxylase superfamily)